MKNKRKKASMFVVITVFLESYEYCWVNLNARKLFLSNGIPQKIINFVDLLTFVLAKPNG